MADLEALTRIDPTSGAGSSVTAAPGQYSWRYTLPEGKLLWLGRDPVASDWAVPEDRMISGKHASLAWNGEALTVARRGPMPPEYPQRPQNQIWFKNKPVEVCEVRPGEWFVIGQTRFTLRGDADSEPEPPVDATLVQRQEERSRAELESLPFSNAALFLKAMEQLPAHLKLATDEAGLYRQMLRIALSAMPKCDAAAVVRVPPDCPVGDTRVTVVAQNVRRPSPDTPGEFVPSRKLVRRAVCRAGKDRKSVLHVWSTEPSDYTQSGNSDYNITLGALHQQGATPWAICTPFHDPNLPYAFYASGRLVAPAPGAAPDHGHLVEYQKFIEILVGLLETTRRTLRLTRQLATAKMTWPANLRKLLDDPERLEGLLKTPHEKDVAVLFCDLRGFSGFAEEQGANLAGAWGEVQKALDTMSSAVTEKGGIVAGFRGDAVLGFWGWPDQHPAQIEKSAEAALRIYDKLAGSVRERKCGVGITHGRALAGRLGAHDLAVVDLYGPVVNLAFRLEEMTKAYEVGIVVSDEVANRLRAADPAGSNFRLRTLGSVRPRGMKVPLTAYELAPATGYGLGSWVCTENYETNLPLWDEAVGLFVQGDWVDAAARFEDFVAAGDRAADCFLRHIRRHGGSPPEGWDGAFTPRPEEK